MLFTRIPLRHCLAIFPKKLSIRFSHEPCLGVNTNSKRPGFVTRYFCVSFDVWAEWLSSTRRRVSCSGYLLSSILSHSIKSLLLWLSLTRGMTSPVRRSNPASRDRTLPNRSARNQYLLQYILLRMRQPYYGGRLWKKLYSGRSKTTSGNRLII